MTEEQYNRALEIYSRVNALKRVSEMLSKSHLTYVREATSFAGREVVVNLPEITDILEYHEELIRVAVAEEIKALMKEIETL